MDETIDPGMVITVATEIMLKQAMEYFLRNHAVAEAAARVMKKQLWRWKMSRTPMAKHHAETALIQYRTMTGMDL